MNKARKNKLALPQVTDYRLGQWLEQTDTTIDKRKYINETPRQRTSIYIRGETAEFAMDQMVEVRKHAMIKFYETAEYMVNVQERAQGTAFENYVNDFGHFMIQSTSQDLIATTRAASICIAEEAMKPPFSFVSEEPKKGFFARLVGG